MFPTSDEDSSTPDLVDQPVRTSAGASFRPLTRIHLLLTVVFDGDQSLGYRFPTSDEDSSTPDQCPTAEGFKRVISFRPLTRIHLLLTTVNGKPYSGNDSVSDL